MSPVALAHRRSLAKKVAAFFKNSHLCAQLAVLRPQPGDLGRLRGGLGVLVLGVLLLVLGDPAPHRLRNQIVGGGHGRDRALLLQDLANDLLLELIGVLRSRHELILFCRGKKLSPSPEDPAHSRVCQDFGSGRVFSRPRPPREPAGSGQARLSQNVLRKTPGRRRRESTSWADLDPAGASATGSATARRPRRAGRGRSTSPCRA